MIVLKVTTGGDTAHLVAGGYDISLTLSADGTTCGTLLVAEGSGLSLDLAGGWSFDPNPLKSGWIMTRIPSVGTCASQLQETAESFGCKDRRPPLGRNATTHSTDSSSGRPTPSQSREWKPRCYSIHHLPQNILSSLSAAATCSDGRT